MSSSLMAATDSEQVTVRYIPMAKAAEPPVSVGDVARAKGAQSPSAARWSTSGTRLADRRV